MNSLSKIALMLCLVSILLMPRNSTAQTSGLDNRVKFTLTNSSLRNLDVEIRYFDHVSRSIVGYGCKLGMLHKRTDNKPVGTRLYILRGGKRELVYVLGKEDQNAKIDLSRSYEISREQWIQVSYDELNEETERLKDPSESNDIASVAKEKGLSMVTFRIVGKSIVGKQVHVRVQLPYETERGNNGFSRRLSVFNTEKISYPVGTKVYLCEGPYWNGPVAEALILTVDEEKSNYTLKL
jgi:hypothetical protein